MQEPKELTAHEEADGEKNNMVGNRVFTTTSMSQQLIENNKIRTVMTVKLSGSSDMQQFLVHLPTITLPTFNGNFKNWIEFRDAFESFIHKKSEISNLEKFNCLNFSLKGKAAELIKPINVCPENYDTAWNLLYKHFENKKLIVRSNIQALCDLKCIKNDSYVPVQRLSNSVMSISRLLEHYNQLLTADAFLVHIVTSKFSPSMRREWESFEPADDFPTVQQLLDFLEKYASTLWAIRCSQTSCHTNTTQSIDCNYCSGSHTIYHCESFLELNVKDRMLEAKRLQLCLNCLKKNHVAKNCRLKPCTQCNRKHNRLLHIENTADDRALVH